MASLRDLGLSEYEARAYRSLLKTGPTTAKELSRVSDVPMGRIYDVLNSLEAQNVVRSQSASRPKKYAPVEPEKALERLLSSKKAELESKIEHYEGIVESLEERLEAAEPVDEPFWTAALGPEEAVDLLVERLAAADERIVFVAATPTSQFELDVVGERITDELTTALDRGLTVSALLHPTVVETLPETVGERYRTYLQEEREFQVRTSDDVYSTFTLLDHTEVCIEVPHPLNPRKAFALINLKDSEFASNVESEFGPRWERSEELVL
jgi:sugar-specific transcriptional regulator TrmB